MHRKEGDTICFYDVYSPYGEFSNFWNSKDHHKKYGVAFTLMIGESEWNSTEEHYQAAKFQDQGELGEKYVEIIRATSTDAKKYALANQRARGRFIHKWMVDPKNDRRRIVDIIQEYIDKGLVIRGDWGDVRDDVMREAVLAKFSQNLDLKKLLLSTAPSQLVEDSPQDAYWGIGKEGTGENMLGKILVETRDTLNRDS